jgi:fatty-acyl-CoA synthase
VYAAGLLALGLQPGDRVSIWSPNNAEWAIAQFATAKAGLILVTINPAYRVGEAEYALNEVGCKGLILATSHKTSDYIGTLNTLASELATSRPGELRSKRLPHLRTAIQIGGHAPGTIAFEGVYSIGQAAGARALAEAALPLRPDDHINIQFTSGTTGAPKGATLTHTNILNNAYFSGRILRFTAGDRLCLPVPLYHCFGMVLGNLLCMLHGAAVIYPSDSFDALAVLQTVAEERCTALHGVPTMFIAEMEHPEFGRFDLSTLRTGIMAASPCPIEVMRRAVDRMGLREITIGYGMTETSPLSCQASPEDTLERRVTTVGRAPPACRDQDR